MKKILFYFLPVLFFVTFFISFNLDAFADGFEFPTAGVTIKINGTKAYDYSTYTQDFELESIYPIVYVQTASDRCLPFTPLEYGHYRSRSYTDPSNKGNFGDWYSIGWSSVTVTIDNEQKTIYSGNVSYNPSIVQSMSNVIVFNSPESAARYFEDPESADNLDNIVNDEGKEIVQDSISPDIDWGNNDPNDVDNPWRPDTENIPAPQFEVVYDENGNVTNQIRFTNYIYNYSAGHGEERIYGLRMTVMWNTYGSFLFDHTGGLLSQEYKVTYSDLLVGDIDTVFAFPEKENQIVRCPQTFSFNTNQAVIDSFNDLLQTYDVDERTYNTNFSVSNDLTLTNKFKSFLERINCPYNTITFSVQYYRRMSDGTFHYGPWSTGKFTAPQQGAIFNANGVTLSGVGGMVQGNGGGLSGTDESGNWNNNWGNNTSDNLFNMSDLELDKVKANMTGLFSFFGEMPSFIQQCFLFLPDWVIAFIIACIVLVCAIGALKLALG